MGNGLCCLSRQDDDSLLRCLGWQPEARAPLLTAEPANNAEAPPKDVETPPTHAETAPKDAEIPLKDAKTPPKDAETPPKDAETPPKDVGYVVKTALETLKRKLKENEEVTEELLYQLPSCETNVADDVLVPVKMGADSNIDVVNVKQMIEKLKPKGAAEAYTKAAEYFEVKPEDERPRPMKFAEWEKAQEAWEKKKEEQKAWEETQHFLHDLEKIPDGSRKICVKMEEAADSLKGSKKCVLAAVTKNGLALQYADRQLKADREVALAAVTNKGKALQYVVDNPKNDTEVVLAAVAQHYSDAIRYVKKEGPMWKERDFVMGMVQKDGKNLKFATSDLKGDRDVVFTAFQKMGFAVEQNMSLQQLVLTAVARNGKALEYASNDKKSDKDVVFTAFQQMKFPVENQMPLRDMVLTAVNQNGNALEYLDPQTKANKDVVLAAVKNSSNAWIYASDDMRKDKDILFEAFSKQGITVDQNMSVEDLLLAKYKVNGFAFQHAANSLRSNKGFVLEVVKVFGEALEFADGQLKADKDVVLAAITSRGQHAFEFVDKKADFWKDRDFVLRMVQWNGKALEFADGVLKKDEDVVLAAVKQSGKALKFADWKLKQSSKCLKAAGLWDFDYDEKKSFQVTQSVKFSLGDKSTTYASEFALAMKKDPILKEYKAYNPNAFEKGSCDPGFTTFDHKCRGTLETCQFPKFKNLNLKEKPYEMTCWRFAFRWHLEQCKENNGFMIQVQEKSGLGAGQRIETVMAEQVGLKVFRTLTESDDFRQDRIEKLRAKIEEWKNSGRVNNHVEEVWINKDRR